MKSAVLFVHSNSELYGADFILLEVVRALKDQVRPIVALPGEGELTEALRDEGVTVVQTHESILRRVNFRPHHLPAFTWNVARDTQQLVRIIRRENVRLVYSNTGAIVTGTLAARICGIPNLYHIHEIVVHPAWLARFIARMVLSNANEVIAVSNAVREQLLRFGRTGDPPVRVIHNGLNPEQFNSCEDVLEARQEMGAGPGDVLFGVIGRIHPWKGQSYFIESARWVAEKCPEARFVIIGGTFRGYEYLLKELEKQVSDRNLGDRLRILSHRRDVPRLMQALDVFVLPSTLPDPLPTVVLEAMAARRPVVATAQGGALEMVVHGQTGLLAPYHDSAGFAEAMLELASDNEKRRRMGEAGRWRLQEDFSRDRFFADVCHCVMAHLPLSSVISAAENIQAQII